MRQMRNWTVEGKKGIRGGGRKDWKGPMGATVSLSGYVSHDAFGFCDDGGGGRGWLMPPRARTTIRVPTTTAMVQSQGRMKMGGVGSACSLRWRGRGRGVPLLKPPHDQLATVLLKQPPNPYPLLKYSPQGAPGAPPTSHLGGGALRGGYPKKAKIPLPTDTQKNITPAFCPTGH